MPKTTTATELQRNYRRVAKRVKKAKEPIAVLSNNKPELIIMDYGVYENWVKKEAIKAKKSNLDKFFGTWSKEEADKFDAIIEDAFEQINTEGWK